MSTAINGHIAPALTGYDAFDLAGVHATMKKVFPAGNTSAMSAIDLALYDALGLHLGVPVSQLLGGTARGPVASSKAVGTGPVDEMVAAARRHLAEGYRTIKIKTGLDDTAELAAIRAIREAHGPNFKIKLDANQGWTLAQAVRFLSRAEKYDIETVEQPLPAADLKGTAELRRRTSVPVMLDESVHGPGDALRAIEARACDYINVKLLKAGGLYPALAIVAVCEAGDIACQIGSLSTSIGTAAAVHLIHARPAFMFAEINWPTRLSSDLATGFTITNGAASVEPAPGLGIRVDDSLLRAAA